MNPTRSSRVIAALAALTLALVAPAAAASAATTDVSAFSFESFDAAYDLGIDADGFATTQVVETIVARFPDFDQNRGIIRAIPLTDGEVPLEVTMLSVTDENGAPVYFERDDYAGFAEFALGTDDFVHGRTTYVLEYTLRNTIRHFADSGGDEFYWDVNGNGWAQTFDTVSATVTVSPELASALTGKTACYLGYYGDTAGGCTIEQGETGSQFEVTVGPVPAYNTLTVAIGFEGGTVVQPQLPRDNWIVKWAPQVLLWLALGLVAFALVFRIVRWRDAPGRGIIIAQFEPPEGSHLLLDADIVRRQPAGLPAQFIDFAVRGLIRVIDTDPGAALGRVQTRFAIELVSAEGVTPRELQVLIILFGADLTPGDRVTPGALTAIQGSALYSLPAKTSAHAVSEGYRIQPSDTVPKAVGWIGWLLVLAFVPIWAWAGFHDVLESGVVMPTLGVILLAIFARAILTRPKLLTEAGAELRDYLLGMRHYITIAEAERMRVLQSPQGALRVDVTDRDAVVKLNERLLPYAVLWGVEDQWAEQLKAQYPSGTPSWLEGDTFDSSFLRGFTVSSVSSVRPIVSSSSGGGSWSSSGGSSFSSGSSGGGFSGGGGGGGGGGGR